MYGRSLTRALAKRNPGRYTLVHPWSRWRGQRQLREDFPELPLRVYSSGKGLEQRFSLVHSLDTRIPRSHDGPLVVNLFDTLSLLPLRALSSASFRRKKQRVYKKIGAQATAIVTLSEAVRDEIVNRISPRARVRVIPPGVDPPPRNLSAERVAQVLEGYGIRAPFLLSVGALCPRKNVEAIVEAFEAARSLRPELKLVLVGEPAFGWEGSVGQAASRRAGGSVISPGYLPRDALWCAYLGASALLHLSHYEGYGLTIVEALAARTPVVAADRGGVPEAGGGAAWLVNPDDREETLRALQQVLAGGEAVEERCAQGVRHASSLTWEAAARRMEELYREVGGGL